MSIICYVLTTFYLCNLGLLKQEITVNLRVNTSVCGLQKNERKGERNSYKFSFSLVNTVCIEVAHLPS